MSEPESILFAIAYLGLWVVMFGGIYWMFVRKGK